MRYIYIILYICIISFILYYITDKIKKQGVFTWASFETGSAYLLKEFSNFESILF